MGKRLWLLLVVLVLGYGATMAIGFKGEKPKSGEGDVKQEWFLLPNSESVIKTDAGEMRVVRSHGGRIFEKLLHIGFIKMEPRTLFLPLYLDSNLILFIHAGQATVGLIYKDHMVERELKNGDVYQIPAGSTFYILNTEESQRLHIICSIDPSESLNMGTFQPFFIGEGTYPTSVLAGFGSETLSTAFNVSASKVSGILRKQQEGPIVYLTHSHGSSIWTKFLLLEQQDRLKHVKRMHKAPKSYNIYKKSPDFKNNYGWRTEVDGSEYKPLKNAGIGIFLVNLTAGSMLAPHLNPRATEYSIVLRGSGRVQVVYPNGTLAMDTYAKEGDMFWVPRYFPFCQIASKSEPFKFLGFTTSSHKNRPQFLVGANSLLHTLNNLELADAFGVSKKRIRRLINAQHESVILPLSSLTDDDDKKNKVFAF
ncbi:hypothetical protein E1A91_A03G178300v1 [Gossypium mustelinum]|uniref:Cupin type-1 domain-containing protein n=1 Tax=Gossypium mustelinum TaxID=34275 RepID=A0A5D3A0D8_GOSMU|nr:hypothetical protein E1A91_A03G178300v1 [Gossypium mustelinum]